MNGKQKTLVALGILFFACVVIWAVRTVPETPKIDHSGDDQPRIMSYDNNTISEEKDGVKIWDLTADRIYGWLKDEHYIGEGNAHVVSPSRAMEAGGDQMDYYGKEQGKAVITGNAWAVQENNTMRSNRMTIYLADDGSAKVK